MLTITIVTGAWKLLIYAQYCTGQARPGYAAITVNSQILVAYFLCPLYIHYRSARAHIADCHLNFNFDGAVCSKEKRKRGEVRTGS